MKYNIKKGDLFDLGDEYTLVHCISLDCVMGAGIALTFTKKFPDLKPKVKECIVVNKLKYPCVVGYLEERHIINMITKEFCYDKPTYGSFTKALEYVKGYCKKYDVKKLGMPKIGCGIDGLDWNIVEDIIKDTFLDMNIEIQVRYI